MKLEDLQMLAILHQTQNLTKTAQKLYISQPALTVRLHNLEKELDCQIAVRTNKGLSFTPEGDYLADAAVRITAQLEETLQGIRAMSDRASGTIKVLAPASFFRYCMLDMTKDFEQAAPNIKLQMELTDSVYAAPKVEALEASCAFVHGDYCSTLPHIHIGSMPAYAVSSEEITLDQLKDRPFITHNTSPKTIEMIQDWWQEQFHEELRPYANMKNLDLCLHMVKSGFGASIVFGDFFRDFYDLRTLPLYNENGSRFSRDVYFLYSPKLQDSPSMKIFIDFVKTYFAEGMRGF
ncbi:MAG: LysR family transcriptional regulator [Firmicutes bacterium]|nr:LysR family transcriptional regulator [Bacillota bacterium]